MSKKKIQEALQTILSAMELAADEVQIEKPRDPTHGDFSSNVALMLAKSAGQPPRALAERIAASFREHTPDVEVSIAGPGFLNFRLQSQAVVAALAAQLREGPQVGRSNLGEGRKVQLEYVSANPTGPLNVVSARAAAYGSTLAAILRQVGFDTHSEFYVNDAGRQVELLGTSVRARCLQLRGEPVDFPEDGYQGDYIRDLAQHLPPDKVADWLRLEPEASSRAFGSEAVEHMLRSQREDLERFGVHYERWFRESELHEQGLVQQTLQALQKNNYVYESDGALKFRSTAWGDDKDRVVVKSDGSPTYFLADAAYHRDKHERGFTTVINVWGPDHHGHIVRMQSVAQALGYAKDWLQVVIVQWVKLVEDGEAVKMSKRAGQLILLSELLDEVGSDVAKYFFLKRQQNAHLDFDLALAKRQSDDNPVYYVKYAHARICSVIRKAAERGWQLEVEEKLRGLTGGREVPLESLRLERLQQPEEHQLMGLLLDYPDFLKRAAEAREPHRLTGFCEDLARVFHKFYHEHRIIQDDRELGLARLALCHATRRVLASALGLMSIEAPQSM